MKYLMLLCLVCSSLAAKDQWRERWEDRVSQADNPDAKAQDMVSDWMFDHARKIRDCDEKTMAEGQRIIDWMAEHDIPLPARAEAAYQRVQKACAAAKGEGLGELTPAKIRGARGSGDDGLSGELLPRSSTEMARQAADDLRHPRIPEPTRTVRAEIVDLNPGD